MSARLASPVDPERRVRSTLKKVFGFEAFKTPLQEQATMAVVKGNAAPTPGLPSQKGRPSQEPRPMVGRCLLSIRALSSKMHTRVQVLMFHRKPELQVPPRTVGRCSISLDWYVLESSLAVLKPHW